MVSTSPALTCAASKTIQPSAWTSRPSASLSCRAIFWRSWLNSRWSAWFYSSHLLRTAHHVGRLDAVFRRLVEVASRSSDELLGGATGDDLDTAGVGATLPSLTMRKPPISAGCPRGAAAEFGADTFFFAKGDDPTSSPYFSVNNAVTPSLMACCRSSSVC